MLRFKYENYSFIMIIMGQQREFANHSRYLYDKAKQRANHEERAAHGGEPTVTEKGETITEEPKKMVFTMTNEPIAAFAFILHSFKNNPLQTMREKCKCQFQLQFQYQYRCGVAVAVTITVIQISTTNHHTLPTHIKHKR